MLCRGSHYIVLFWSISKFISEDVKQLSSPPSLLAVCVICVMIRVYLPKAIFEVVGSRPWITRSRKHFCRGAGNLILRFRSFHVCYSFNRCQCHGDRVQQTLPRKKRVNKGCRSQLNGLLRNGKRANTLQSRSSCQALADVIPRYEPFSYNPVDIHTQSSYPSRKDQELELGSISQIQCLCQSSKFEGGVITDFIKSTELDGT